MCSHRTPRHQVGSEAGAADRPVGGPASKTKDDPSPRIGGRLRRTPSAAVLLLHAAGQAAAVLLRLDLGHSNINCPCAAHRPLAARTAVPKVARPWHAPSAMGEPPAALACATGLLKPRAENWQPSDMRRALWRELWSGHPPACHGPRTLNWIATFWTLVRTCCKSQ